MFEQTWRQREKLQQAQQTRLVPKKVYAPTPRGTDTHVCFHPATPAHQLALCSTAAVSQDLTGGPCLPGKLNELIGEIDHSCHGSMVAPIPQSPRDLKSFPHMDSPKTDRKPWIDAPEKAQLILGVGVDLPLRSDGSYFRTP